MTDRKHIVSGKTLLGAIVGGLIGGVAGGPWGAALGAGVGGSAFTMAQRRKQAHMSPTRRIEFEKACATVKDPKELRVLAADFERDGLRAQAKVLRSRADMRDLPDDVKDARRTAFRSAFSWKKAADLERFADLYENECAFAAAKKLRLQAAAVRAADAAKTSGTPAPSETAASLRDSLVEVIRQFGPTSQEAKDAAANYLHASTGKEPIEADIEQEIQAASPPAPPAAEPPPPAAAEPVEVSPP